MEQQPHATGPSSVRLNGSEAVNRAAEQWQDSAQRNIPEIGLGEVPVPADSANLRQRASLHDGLLALLPLVGVWQGTGQAHDADGTEYAFGQELIFSHDGENYLHFSSRTWRLNSAGDFAGVGIRETGFWRISTSDEIEVTYTSSTGVVEILYGEPFNDRAWQLESASTMVTATGPATLGPGKRMYGLMPNNNLGWVDERLVDGELRPFMSAELQRVAG